MQEIPINPVFQVNVEKVQNEIKRWSKKVIKIKQFHTNPDTATKDLKNDFIDFRGLSWSYLQKLWLDVVNQRRYQNIYLVVVFHGGKNLTCRKLEQSTRVTAVLLTPNKVTIRKPEEEIKEKERKDWTTFDFLNFVIQPTLNETGQQSFIESTFDQHVGEPFKGSYVIAPGSSKMDHLMKALSRYYSKKQRLHTTNKEDYIWIETFSSKNIDLLRDIIKHGKSIKIGKLRKTKLYKYAKKILPKVIGMFDERLVFLNNWKRPLCLTEAWSLWQIFCCIQSCKGFKFIYDKRTSDQFHEILSQAEDNELESNVQVFQDIDKFEDNNPFSTIKYFEPCKITSSRNIFRVIVLDIFSHLPNGFSTLIFLLQRDICKEIAIKHDNDIFFIVKEEMPRMLEEKPRKILNLCTRVRQIGIFMRNINEPLASASFLRQTIRLYEAITTEDEHLMFKISEARALCHISLARTLWKQKDYELAIKELELVSAFAKGAPFSEFVLKKLKREIALVVAGIHFSSGKYTEALTRYEDCLEGLKKETNNLVCQTNKLVNNKTSSDELIKKQPSFQTFSARMLEGNSTYRKVQVRKVRLLLIMGFLYKDQLGRVQSAELNFFRAFEIIKEVGLETTFECAQAYMGLSGVKMMNKDYKSAVKKLTEAIAIIGVEIGDTNLLYLNAVKQRAICCKKLGDEDQASFDIKTCFNIARMYYGEFSDEVKALKKLFK